jgi:protein YIPF6
MVCFHRSVLLRRMTNGLRCRGPLIFCLLLSMFLSMRAHDEQSSLVFSGVFSIVWIGEAIVTLQIKLLGGNMYVGRNKENKKKDKANF